MSDVSDDMLDFDPLDAAEKITGSRYSDDPTTQALGFMLMQAHSEIKREALSAESDTHMSMTWEDAQSVFTGLGFDEVWRREWVTGLTSDRGPEQAVTYWRPDGILLEATSFWGNLNSAQFYGNLDVTGVESWSRLTSSGSFNTPAYDAGRRVWIGSWDAREGLKRKLREIERSEATWLSEWIERPWLGLLHGEEYRYDKHREYREKQDAAVLNLPANVLSAIGSDEDHTD